MQVVLRISLRAETGLDASAEFNAEYLGKARAMIADPKTTELVVIMPLASPDHDDWRRTLARDLARAYAPSRVNVVAADDPEAEAELLSYLRDAPGVTGQYLQAHG